MCVCISTQRVSVYVTSLCVRAEGNYPVCTHSVVKEGGTARMLLCNQAVRLRFKLPHCHLKIGEHSGRAIAEVEPQITRCCFFWAWSSFSKLRACLLFMNHENVQPSCEHCRRYTFKEQFRYTVGSKCLGNAFRKKQTWRKKNVH